MSHTCTPCFEIEVAKKMQNTLVPVRVGM